MDMLFDKLKFTGGKRFDILFHQWCIKISHFTTLGIMK